MNIHGSHDCSFQSGEKEEFLEEDDFVTEGLDSDIKGGACQGRGTNHLPDGHGDRI